MGDRRQLYLGETSGYRGIPVFNAEQDRTISLKKPFMKLMALASAVNQEEQRYVCEKFESNKEVSLYDMLFRDEIIKEDIEDKKVHSKPVKENKKLIYHT